MQPLHPKVKVPAIIGTIISVALAVALAALAGASDVPAVAAYAAAGVTALQTISGYLTYSR